jgi:hypothetical protein
MWNEKYTCLYYTIVQQTVMSVGAGAIHDLLSCCIACTLLIDCVCLKILTAWCLQIDSTATESNQLRYDFVMAYMSHYFVLYV